MSGIEWNDEDRREPPKSKPGRDTNFNCFQNWNKNDLNLLESWILTPLACLLNNFL